MRCHYSFWILREFSDGMNSSNNDLVTMKKLIIDFNNYQTDLDDITKYFSNYTLLPTMDIETIGNGDVSEFDIN